MTSVDTSQPDATDSQRSVLVVVHGGRAEARDLARTFCANLAAVGVHVRVGQDEAAELVDERAFDSDIVASAQGAAIDIVAADADAAAGCELVVVFGGDGTILRGAELARPHGTPLLGVNLGHVGFLAEAERDGLANVVEAIKTRSYSVEDRLALDVRVSVGGVEVSRDWALNDASVEKVERERMLEVIVEVDGRPLSQWGCDGVVCATPTGSTAYAFSAGGPVVWPEVEALLLVPISAHALFARPLVVSPRSVLAVELQPRTHRGVLWCDGRRTTELAAGARVEVRRHDEPVRLARLHPGPFTDRLVAKFELPVSGWRGSSRSGPTP